MGLGKWAIKPIVFVTACALVPQSHAQGDPAAIQRLHSSAFAGLTGTYTGLESGRNLGLTAGADLGFRSYFALEPSLELRGTYAFDTGAVDGQKNLLGGLNLTKKFNRFQLYGDVLFGRGQIDYKNGLPDPKHHALYLQTYSNIPAVGGGIDIPFSEHLRLKADAQFQRYSTPVTESGRLYAEPLTLGLVYRFSSRRILAP